MLVSKKLRVSSFFKAVTEFIEPELREDADMPAKPARPPNCPKALLEFLEDSAGKTNAVD